MRLLIASLMVSCAPAAAPPINGIRIRDMPVTMQFNEGVRFRQGNRDYYHCGSPALRVITDTSNPENWQFPNCLKYSEMNTRIEAQPSA